MITKILATAYLVDGSLQEFEFDEGFLSELQRLQAEGYSGKQLVHRLITDDWAAPPRQVKIEGTTEDGKTVSITLEYS